jgi:uncharacterized protein YndB with AHSA1/START domain
MSETKVTVQSDISANPEKVWHLYNSPEHITQWNFAADSWCCPSAEVDLRPGGKMRSRMEAKDGSFGFYFEVVYDRVIHPKEIAYTMGDGRQAIVSFEDMGSGTHMVITFDAEGENPVDMQQQGWQAILDNFKRYAEANG